MLCVSSYPDYGHFESVIKGLQTAAQAEKESKVDNSQAVSLQDDSEDSNPETMVCTTLHCAMKLVSHLEQNKRLHLHV